MRNETVLPLSAGQDSERRAGSQTLRGFGGRVVTAKSLYEFSFFSPSTVCTGSFLFISPWHCSGLKNGFNVAVLGTEIPHYFVSFGKDGVRSRSGASVYLSPDAAVRARRD